MAFISYYAVTNNPKLPNPDFLNFRINYFLAIVIGINYYIIHKKIKSNKRKNNITQFSFFLMIKFSILSCVCRHFSRFSILLHTKPYEDFLLVKIENQTLAFSSCALPLQRTPL